MLRNEDLLAMHEDLLFVALHSDGTSIVRDARSLCERLTCAMRADVDIDLESGWTFIRDHCDATSLIAAARDALQRGRRSRERNDLLAAVGHEIRTPLTSIRGYIETVLDDEANHNEERRFLLTAQREAARLARFVDGLLTCSLLDIQANLDGAECDLTTAVSAACDIVAPIAATLNIELRDAIHRNARLCCPEDVLVRILNILLENAIHYGARPGVIEIRGYVDESDVLISVHDNGPGIAHGDEERIFAPVQRGRNAPGSGCGLGLAIAKSLVEQYDGDIGVGRSPLGGAKFDVRFRHKAEATVNAANVSACDSSAHATLRRSDDRKPRTRSR